MPERLRAITSRLRQYVADRRRNPRFRVRLEAAVSLFDLRATTPWSKPLIGHACDVSAGGIGLILPAIRSDDRYLVGQNQTLRVTLKLPRGTVRVYTTPVRYERLEDAQPNGGFLVGVRIDEMDEQDRKLFTDYLEELKRGTGKG